MEWRQYGERERMTRPGTSRRGGEMTPPPTTTKEEPKLDTNRERMTTTIPNTTTSRTQERKLCNQHAKMGCLRPYLRHHQVGPVQGL